MNVKDFFDKYNDKGIDFDGSFGFQCVDLYRQYVKEVIQSPQSPAVAGAKDIWITYLKDWYDRIENTPEGVPQLGDIVIWQAFSTNPYGHVAIFSEGTNKSFTSFDQNWPVGSLCHFQGHYYNNVLGWLRPKSASSQIEITDQTKIPQIDNLEVQAIRSKIKDQEKAIANLQQDLQIYKDQPVPIPQSPQFNNKIANLLFQLARAIEHNSDS